MESCITEICLNFRPEWPRTFAPLFFNYNNWYLINVLYSTNVHNRKNIVLQTSSQLFLEAFDFRHKRKGNLRGCAFNFLIIDTCYKRTKKHFWLVMGRILWRSEWRHRVDCRCLWFLITVMYSLQHHSFCNSVSQVFPGRRLFTQCRYNSKQILEQQICYNRN